MTIPRARFAQILGFEEPPVTLLSKNAEQRDGYTLETLRLTIGDTPVRGILARPTHMETPRPAILYAHSHGGGYAIGAREMLDGREYLQEPLGPVLARLGYIALAIDMPLFGERNTVSESAAAKALLWHGKCLMGQMLSEQAAALTYLAARDDVDATRIGAYGMSMGSTLSYWLAALDDRLKAVAHLNCFADQRTMIDMGAHDGHGIYMTVPGLLAETDAGGIAAGIAPRPQLVCLGGSDALTPMPAIERAWADLEPAYANDPEKLERVLDPAAGHEETPAMRRAVLDFFAKFLG
ncbi:alpha/beta hydrolase family protein [Pelagibacterium xiamenense]|uniref:alpha/beta hydrolase family protein n=1 Tax=Pelagibacterium xiamenense TaxID=2901140 RepID=UPI001E30803F|nr:dienelactone hydrolase family protein [Pelagibacterium xiamenense]MCD7060512.1 dienelactone hydrolase family protein [Pelagibacterium xiamenense]